MTANHELHLQNRKMMETKSDTNKTDYVNKLGSEIKTFLFEKGLNVIESYIVLKLLTETTEEFLMNSMGKSESELN